MTDQAAPGTLAPEPPGYALPTPTRQPDGKLGLPALHVTVVGQASSVRAHHERLAAGRAQVAERERRAARWAAVRQRDAFAVALGTRRGGHRPSVPEPPQRPAQDVTTAVGPRRPRPSDEMALVFPGSPYRHFGETGPAGSMLWAWQKPWCARSDEERVGKRTPGAVFDAAPDAGPPCPLCALHASYLSAVQRGAPMALWLSMPSFVRAQNLLGARAEVFIARHGGVLDLAAVAAELGLPSNRDGDLTLPAAMLARALAGRPGGVLVSDPEHARLLRDVQVPRPTS